MATKTIRHKQQHTLNKWHRELAQTSSQSSLCQIGSGVPQKRSRDIAQSRAPCLTGKGSFGET